jgi:YYY domain-containing protein
MEYGLVATWLLAYLLLLLVGMPVARALVPQLPDRGAGIALPIALAVVWLVAYFVGFLSITAGLWLGVAALVVLALGLQRRGNDLDLRRFAETAAVFSLAFLFVIGLRAFDPAASAPAGEKFLDMGLLQSLMRSSTIPPEDPWFAGETVRYYYGGHYLSSLLARLTGTEARFAYNPALAGFYAMLVTGVYGLAGSIAADRGFPRVPAALAGAFFVGFASNLLTPLRFVFGVLPDSVADPVAGSLGVEISGVAESLSAFSYWPASRIIEATINEFPLFAWLNGDLHAHMMSPMVFVVVIGVLADVWMGGEGRSRRRTLFALFGAVPALAGMIAVFNSWSFPAVGGLVAVTVWLGPVSPASLLHPRVAAWERAHANGPTARELSRIGLAAVSGIAALALGFLWSLPYWLWTASSQSSVGVLPSRSALGGLLVVHGAFLALFWLFAYRHAGRPLDRLQRWGVLAFSGGLLAVSIVLDAPAVGLFGPLIVLGWLLLRWWAPTDALFADAEESVLGDAAPASDGGRTGPGFETVLIVAFAGLVLAVEFVHVAEPLAPERFNTVFKAYAQVWILAAVAAGVVVVRLLVEHAPELSLSGPRWQTVFAVVVAALLASTALYGVLAVSDHVGSDAHRDTDELTLDALAYVAEDHPDEAPAIEYLLYEVEGQPNMVDYPNDLGYTWANAPSSMTGVPTLAGWWPARGYHGTEWYNQRVEDVQTIYTGDPEMQRYLLDYYNVELVYVGPHEREQYEGISVDQLEAVTVEQRWDAVTIYRVDQSALDTDAE